jgi:hypothetical protein
MATVVLAASQVGHLLTTELRQGPGALSLPGTGVHAYLPALLTASLGAAGAVVLAALMVVAAARAVGTGRHAAIIRPAGGSLLDLAAALFAAQLATYLVQETVEAAAAGVGLPSPGDLVLWGSAGQLPVAVLAAVALRWLTGSVEAAVIELAAAAGQPLTARTSFAPGRTWTAAAPLLRCRPADRTATGRGPPPLLCPAG